MGSIMLLKLINISFFLQYKFKFLSVFLALPAWTTSSPLTLFELLFLLRLTNLLSPLKLMPALYLF